MTEKIPVVAAKRVNENGRIYDVPVLTELERFVYENGNRSPHTIATELNRSERAVNAAYGRADKKVRDLTVLTEWLASGRAKAV